MAYEPRGRDVGVLGRLYVLLEFHRRKIGTALVTHVEGRVKGQGVREILLWTDVKVIWAVSFYKWLGYHEIDPGEVYSDEYIDARIRKHECGIESPWLPNDRSESHSEELRHLRWSTAKFLLHTFSS